MVNFFFGECPVPALVPGRNMLGAGDLGEYREILEPR